MPWSVDRVGDSVRVRMTPPIDDWEALMDEIWANLDPAPSAVFVPEWFRDSTKVESDLLRLLRVALIDQGVPLRQGG